MRKEYKIVLIEKAQEEFGLDENWRPQAYIQNDYKDKETIVIDHVTGLMWQKSGSAEYMTYEKAREYVQELNRRKFASYSDWRLPTIPELMSLLESEEQLNGLFINPIFDSKQLWCWSADKCLSDSGLPSAAWYAAFDFGYVFWYLAEDYGDVRVVR